MTRLDAFAVCPPGLEPAMASELAGLGIRGRTRHGGVTARVSARQLYAANVNLRTATRIVVRVCRARARDFAALERSVRAVDWAPWIAPGSPVDVRATSHRSRLWHTGAIAERVLDVLSRLGAAEAGDEAVRQRIMVRLAHDELTVSVDSSGEPLHQRGWRLATAKAPLRPTIAAAMLLSSGWTAEAPLIDPFCGSGTIPIEAALLARSLAPGLGRSFAFQRWPSFEPGTWASVTASARSNERAGAGIPIVARDRDDGALAATADNAARAGVAADLVVERATVSDLAPPPGTDGKGPGWLVTNPPYGYRLRAGRDLRDLYARLGQVVARRLPGWTVGMLVSDAAVAGHSRLPLAEVWHTSNGGLPVRFLVTPA